MIDYCLELDIVKKWLPKTFGDEKNDIIKIINSGKNTGLYILLKKYVEIIKPYAYIIGIDNGLGKTREYDCMASGIVFFYGCLIYIMHHENWYQYMTDISLYNILYILVDHYMDDIKIEEEVKKRAMGQMAILIETPERYQELDLEDKILEDIAKIYEQLVKRNPETKNAMKKIFHAEMESVYIQKNSDHSRETYYNLALKKGGYTMEVLKYMVGIKNDDNSTYELGIIMQLIDDCIDVFADLDNGINTIATHDFQKFGNIDNIITEIIHRIDNIDKKYRIFNIIYMMFVTYIPNRIPNAVSPKLYSQLNQYNIFEQINGSEFLTEFIKNELYSLNILEELSHTFTPPFSS